MGHRLAGNVGIRQHRVQIATCVTDPGFEEHQLICILYRSGGSELSLIQDYPNDAMTAIQKESGEQQKVLTGTV